MKVFEVLRRALHNSDAMAQSMRHAVAGIANQNRKLEELISGLAEQTRRLDSRLELIAVELAKPPQAIAGGAGAAASGPFLSPPPQPALPELSAARAPHQRAPDAGDAAPAIDDANPGGEIPYPRIDLARLSNPIPALIANEEFAATVRHLRQHPGTGRSLVGEAGRALLYALVRNQKPRHAIEIGTFRGGMTEVMSRAMLANGVGTLHTVGPFDAEAFTPIYDEWAPRLQQIVCFYPIDSMAFFMEMEARAIRPDLVFIDGNHDYEFALFDLQCAARRLAPGGFIVLDDSDQAGPYFAAQDFLARQPDWIDCASPDLPPPDPTKAFDPERTRVAGTNFVVLRAPQHHRLIAGRPLTFGEMPWLRPEARGLALSLDGRQQPGVIHLQCILRGFGDTSQVQISEAGSVAIAEGMREANVVLAQPVSIAEPVARRTLEAWLIWSGPEPLCLRAIPSPF